MVGRWIYTENTKPKEDIIQNFLDLTIQSTAHNIFICEAPRFKIQKFLLGLPLNIKSGDLYGSFQYKYHRPTHKMTGYFIDTKEVIITKQNFVHLQISTIYRIIDPKHYSYKDLSEELSVLDMAQYLEDVKNNTCDYKEVVNENNSEE